MLQEVCSQFITAKLQRQPHRPDPHTATDTPTTMPKRNDVKTPAETPVERPGQAESVGAQQVVEGSFCAGFLVDFLDDYGAAQAVAAVFRGETAWDDY